jgi:polyhydroxybutyrate depolymerase
VPAAWTVGRRAATAGLACLLMAACTGDRAERSRPPAWGGAGSSLELAVVSRPLDCQPTADVPAGCEVGGSGSGTGLGKVRVFHQVRLARTSTGNCTPATVTGSISGAGWAVSFGGEGEWCGQEGRFGYRLAGQRDAQGRLEYRHGPQGAARETFSGPLPVPPAADAAGPYADRRLASAGCGKRPPVPPGKAVDLTVPADPALAAGARSRRYRVHVPAGYRPGSPAPAVLFFHGFGGSAADTDAGSGLSELADRRGFLAVYPQGTSVQGGSRFWANAGRVSLGVDDLRFTADVLNDLQGRLCVDPARVHAGGFSAGGGVAAWLACELAGRIAAVATVSGQLVAEPGGCRPSRPVPILAVHGTGDEVIPYGGRAADIERPLRLPALPAWLAGWAARNGCTVDSAVFLDTGEVTGVRWSGCRQGTEVVHYRINGGGHPPPRTVAGHAPAEILWDFFAAHPMPG